MALIVLSCAWIAGICAGPQSGLSWFWVLTAPLPLLPLFWRRWRRYRRPAVIACLALAAFFSAANWAQASLDRPGPSQVDFYDGQTVRVRGVVASDPELRETGLSYRLSVSQINPGPGWLPVEGRILVFSGQYPAYHYGDEVILTGKTEAPSGGYARYLANQGMHSVMYYPRAEVLATGKGSPLLTRLYSLRNAMAEAIRRALPEPQAAVMEGIVLGKRALIPAQLKADFSRSGTAHILAISGANLTIVAGILVAAGLWLFGKRRYIYVWLALALVWAYTLLTGLSAPVVRAAIMASVFLLAEMLGRQRSGLPALCLAAAVMTGIHPYAIGDASFQMSVLSMAGLIFFQPVLSESGKRLAGHFVAEDSAAWRPVAAVTDSLAASLAALIGVGPLIAHYFGIVSFAGPLATLLAMPALPGIIFTGGLTGLAGLVFAPVAAAIGWLGWLLVTYLILLVSGAARVPGSFVSTGQMDAGVVWAYYGLVGAALLLKANWRNLGAMLRKARSALAVLSPGFRPQWVLPPLLALAALASVAAATMPDGRLHVYFLDVGQGDAILVQRGSQQVLIDGGPNPAILHRSLGSRMPFWDRDIELVVLTHPHLDHLAGLMEVINRFRVDRVLDTAASYDSPVFAGWRRAVSEKKVPLTVAAAGQEIDLGGGVVMDVLHAAGQARKTGPEPDNDGTVLRLSMGQVSFLFTADIMQATEQELIEERPGLVTTVLKVAHHGSGTSTSAGFLAAVGPQAALISVGADNGYGLPSAEVTGRLARTVGAANVYRTDRQGTIEFVTDGARLWVKTEKAN